MISMQQPQRHHIIISGNKAETSKQNKYLRMGHYTAWRNSCNTLVVFSLLLTKFHLTTLTNTAAKILIYAKINCEQFVQR